MKIYCDGSITKNPGGKMKYAFYVPEFNYRQAELVDDTDFNTNWIPEFTAVYEALAWCLANGLEQAPIEINSDLENVSTLLKHEKLRSKEKTFYPIARKIIALKPLFKDLTFFWIPREENQEADRLSKIY